MTGTSRTVRELVAAMRARLAAAQLAEPLNDARLLIGEVLGFSLTDFLLMISGL